MNKRVSLVEPLSLSQMDAGTLDVTDYHTTIENLETLLKDCEPNFDCPDLFLSQSLNEAWFSNALAWLLDPKGSHGFGVRFLQEFIKRVAKIRSDNKLSARKQSLLKFGKAGSGKIATIFSLKNAAIIREFYLSQGVTRKDKRGSKYCDVVIMDLDAADNFFMVIENKLFTTNHPNQLPDYYDAVETKFQRVKTREYVYLTINGIKPFLHTDRDKSKGRYWARMSWTNDILPILNSLNSEKQPKEVRQIIELLNWINALSTQVDQQQLESFRKALVKVSADCLLEELIRLGEGKTGRWSLEKENKRSLILKHSSYSTPLYIEILPNFTITAQSRKKGCAQFEKIIVPYGTHPDQVFNMLDIAARDIYHLFFKDKKDLYLGPNRRLTKTINDLKQVHKPLFQFVYYYQNQLKVLLTLSDNTWRALNDEYEAEYEAGLDD